MKKTILESRFFASMCGSPYVRTVKDYEIDIECGDDRIYIYNSNEYKLKRGDVLVRKPGDLVSTSGMQKSYLLTLDFSSDTPTSRYNRNVPGKIQELTSNELITTLPPILHPRNHFALFEIYEKLTKMPSLNISAAHSLVDEIIFILNAELAHKAYIRQKTNNEVIDKVISYMEAHLASQITLDELASVSNLEKSYFIRYFKKETGLTPFRMLSAIRLEYASDLVVSTDMKICNIAASLAYNTTSFFISEYKKRFGITPSSHRSGMRKNNIR